MGAFQYARDSDDRRAGLWEVTGRIVMRTSRGILLEGGPKREWLPAAKVIVTDLGDGRSAVAMPRWLAREKGYI